ncbi:membrane protein [Bacteroidia bacterium]|nr:membrane protein [Bacteroidia bacterium]
MKLLQVIKKRISDCFVVWGKELVQVRKDVGVVIFFVLVPLAYPILYGTIYTTETIHNVPMVVVDESHSSLAREFVRKIDATADVQVYVYAASMEEARKIVSEKKAYGILRIPSDFSLRIHRGEQATIGLYIDMSGLLFYKAMLLATTEASLDDFAKQIRYEASGMHAQSSVKYEAVTLFNPQSGFASFLLPAILILVIQQTLLLGIGMLCATVRERNNGRLIPHESYYGGVTRIVFGKALAYLTVYIFICIWALIIVPKIFNLPQIGHYYVGLLFILPYLLACIFFAMMIATFFRGRETPMMILVFTSLIFLFLSGVSWPLQAIPAFWRYFSYLIPSTFGIQGFVKLNTMGAALNEVAWEYKALWLQTAVYFTATCVIYGYNLKKENKQ